MAKLSGRSRSLVTPSPTLVVLGALAALVAVPALSASGSPPPGASAGSTAPALSAGSTAPTASVQEAGPVPAARAYYDALLAADTAAARARSNGLLPIDFGKIEGVRLGEATDRDECPSLPEIPDHVLARADTGPGRRTLDSIAGVLDSLFASMRGAERCAEVPTTLVAGSVGGQDREEVAIRYPTLLRLAPDGWRVDAFVTGKEAVPAYVRMMGSLLGRLGDALERAATDSAGG